MKLTALADPGMVKLIMTSGGEKPDAALLTVITVVYLVHQVPLEYTLLANEIAAD